MLSTRKQLYFIPPVPSSTSACNTFQLWNTTVNSLGRFGYMRRNGKPQVEAGIDLYRQDSVYLFCLFSSEATPTPKYPALLHIAGAWFLLWSCQQMPDDEDCREVSNVFCIAIGNMLMNLGFERPYYLHICAWENFGVSIGCPLRAQQRTPSPLADFSEHTFPVKFGPLNQGTQFQSAPNSRLSCFIILLSWSLISNLWQLDQLDSLGIRHAFSEEWCLCSFQCLVHQNDKKQCPAGPFLLLGVLESTGPSRTLRYHAVMQSTVVLHSWNMLELDSKHQSQLLLFLDFDCLSLRACLARIRSSGSYLTPLSQAFQTKRNYLLPQQTWNFTVNISEHKSTWPIGSMVLLYIW